VRRRGRLSFGCLVGRVARSGSCARSGHHRFQKGIHRGDDAVNAGSFHRSSRWLRLLHSCIFVRGVKAAQILHVRRIGVVGGAECVGVVEFGHEDEDFSERSSRATSFNSAGF